MANRLASSTSPYLQQHADNPVEWWEWSPEAFEEARRRDVPILLSVGYAACHWCHVMAHDSFEDEATAVLMNDGFVNVKVDREERPDVDAVYMQATTALTGHGGWPMTCLLDHDGRPFFAGTFFPRAQFQGLLRSAAQAWQGKRAELTEFGQEVVGALQRRSDAEAAATLGGAASGALPAADQLAAATLRLVAAYDDRNGGFGGAPKFPPSMVLEFLLREHERSGDRAALRMAEGTFEAMARGGMYDQLVGGFARYSVDAEWVVPHFEKMLYDNTLLLKAYLHWWRVSDEPLAERIARETAWFLIRDLGTPEGGFASALDADAAGVEGSTYVWTPAQLAEVLGFTNAVRAAQLLAVTDEGTFEDGASTLQLRADPAAEDETWWGRVREQLTAARAQRPQPGRDDKVVTAWNGLAIGALAEAGILLDEPRFVSAAESAAALLVSRHIVDGRLRRTSRAGVVGAAVGTLEDHGDLADGLLMLHQVTGELRWLEVAADLLAVAMTRFSDGQGGYFDTADDAEQLIHRPRDYADNATPSGLSAVAHALATYAALTGSFEHRRVAEAAVVAGAALWLSQPRFGGAGLTTAQALSAGPLQIAVIGEAGGDQSLTRTAWRLRPPGAVVVSVAPDAEGVALAAGRGLVQGAPAAYVCRGMVCDLPVTDAAELARALG